MTPEEILKLPTENAARAVFSLEPGRRVVGLTKGQFSLINLLEAILAKTGPASLWLSSWTAALRDSQQMALFLDSGRITDLRIYVDAAFPGANPEYCGAVQRVFGIGAIRKTRTHAKIALIRNDRWNLTICTSMNLNRNPRFEHFDVTDSAPLAEFMVQHFEGMGEIEPGLDIPFAEVSAVFDRSLRGQNLFQVPDRAYLIGQGAPLEGTAEEFRGWVSATLRLLAKKKHRLRSWSAIAKRVRVPLRELRAITAEAPTGERAAVCEDIAWRLVEALES